MASNVKGIQPGDTVTFEVGTRVQESPQSCDAPMSAVAATLARDLVQGGQGVQPIGVQPNPAPAPALEQLQGFFEAPDAQVNLGGGQMYFGAAFAPAGVAGVYPVVNGVPLSPARTVFNRLKLEDWSNIGSGNSGQRAFAVGLANSARAILEERGVAADQHDQIIGEVFPQFLHYLITQCNMGRLEYPGREAPYSVWQ